MDNEPTSATPSSPTQAERAVRVTALVALIELESNKYVTDSLNVILNAYYGRPVTADGTLLASGPRGNP